MTGVECVYVTMLCVGLIACIIAAIRNEMTFNFRMRRTEVVSNNIQNAIYNKQPYSLADFNCPMSYYAMMWDLRKWSYEAFFPKGY